MGGGGERARESKREREKKKERERERETFSNLYTVSVRFKNLIRGGKYMCTCTSFCLIFGYIL